MGCIIYELCTGKRPFEANNQAALALKPLRGSLEFHCNVLFYSKYQQCNT